MGPLWPIDEPLRGEESGPIPPGVAMNPDALRPKEPRPAASRSRWLGWAALGAALLPLVFLVGEAIPDEIGARLPLWVVATVIGIPAAPLLALGAWIAGRGRPRSGRVLGCLGLGLWLPVTALVLMSLMVGGASRIHARSRASSWQISSCLKALAAAEGEDPGSSERLAQRLSAWSAREHNIWFRSRPPLCPDGLQVVSGDPEAEAKNRARHLGILVVAYRPPQGPEPGRVAAAMRVKNSRSLEADEVLVQVCSLEPKAP